MYHHGGLINYYRHVGPAVESAVKEFW